MKAFENFFKNRLADDEKKGVKPVFEFAREPPRNEENWFSQKRQDTKQKRKTTKKRLKTFKTNMKMG